MEGTIINYRRGRKTQKTNQMIVCFTGICDKEKAEEIVGSSVTYSCEGKNEKKIIGKVSSPHGSKGSVRVIFERGMPGQAIGGKVEVSK